MKILIVGASGMVGGEALRHCLAHPKITKIVAFVRRELPSEVSSQPKLETIIIKDFAAWPEDVLQAHSDADAMVWTMGAYSGSITADLEYPVAFVESMGKVMEAKKRAKPFRYIQLSGKFVRQNQEEPLWWGSKPRKMKGLADTKAFAWAEAHPSTWETFVVKPGGIISYAWPSMARGCVNWAFGENWTVLLEELGAFMTYLAVEPEEQDHLILNARLRNKGRECLEAMQQGSA